MCNKLVAIQYSMASITPDKLLTQDAKEAYGTLVKAIDGIENLIRDANTALYDSYHRHYATYKGDPTLRDTHGNALYRGDVVAVPNPKATDTWAEAYQGEIISTIRGEGMICVRDPNDDCWDVEASSVEKLQGGSTIETRETGIPAAGIPVDQTVT
jgi:hypothetical protein